MGIDVNRLSKSAQKQILKKMADSQNKNDISGGEEKKNKYNAKKNWEFGIAFDSKKETEYYCNCKLLTKANGIAGFMFHGKFVLVEGNGKEHRAITYEPDFILFYNDGTYEIIDTKSDATITSEFKNKMKMMYEKYPNIKKVKISK